MKTKNIKKEKNLFDEYNRLSEKEKKRYQSDRPCKKCGAKMFRLDEHSIGSLHTFCPNCRICPDCNEGNV